MRIIILASLLSLSPCLSPIEKINLTVDEWEMILDNCLKTYELSRTALTEAAKHNLFVSFNTTVGDIVTMWETEKIKHTKNTVNKYNHFRARVTEIFTKHHL